MFGKRSDQPRTADDRARAAAERAARRTGRPLPPEAFADAVRPPDVEPRDTEEPSTPRDEVVRQIPPEEIAAREEANWRAAEQEATHEPRGLEAASAAEDPPARETDARSSAASRNAARPDDELVHQPTMEYTPFETEEHEVPLGEPHEGEPELVAARGRPAEPQHEAEETDDHVVLEEPRPLRPAPPRAAEAVRSRPAPNAPRRGRRRPPAPPRSTSTGAHWGRRFFALIALVVIVGALYVVYKTFQPFHGEGDGTVQVDIPADTKSGEIAQILKDKGVIDSKTFFELKATVSGERGKLRPGHYTLKKGMKNGAVIAALTKPPAAATPAPTVTLTLVEGPAIRENAPVVDKSKKVKGSYAKAASSKAVLRRIRTLGAPKGTKTAEGFLFPATYTLPEHSTAKKLVDAQLDSFKENFKRVDLSYAKKKNLTRYDVLIIASMVEREAQLAKDRPLVAAVIYNRLKQGMPLQIDATIRYYTHNWQRPIRQSELDDDEPYNLSLNRGLPPTPIGNPGLASIKAAAKPSHKPYLFYVRKCGNSGEHAFSSTDAQFSKDLKAYQDCHKGN